MDYDYQMVRDNKGLNLAVGEPWFLHDALSFFTHAHPDIGSYGYPALGGEPELLHELKEMYPGKRVVVTNGAKGAISAALYALNKHPGAFVTHPVPYWPSFPTLVSERSMDWNTYSDIGKQISIFTWPNNPNGMHENANVWSDIWDACYAHWVYGWDDTTPSHLISVHSAAKLLGLAGLRVGWLVTDEEETEVAKKAAHYVEITTSGVSVTAQRQVANALHFIRMHPEEANLMYKMAKDTLRKNGQTFLRYMGDFVSMLPGSIQGVPLDGSGMFAWFRIAPKHHEAFGEALIKTSVKLVTGEACGMTENGWYRMNMGHREDFTRVALEILEKQIVRGQYA